MYEVEIMKIKTDEEYLELKQEINDLKKRLESNELMLNSLVSILLKQSPSILDEIKERLVETLKSDMNIEDTNHKEKLKPISDGAGKDSGGYDTCTFPF